MAVSTSSTRMWNFVQPLTARDIGELARILDSLIQANEKHHQPG